MSNLLQTAINAALSQDWPKAINTNLSLIKENKNDINALNRLAHAYVQTGKISQAQKIYKKILALDKYNIIASKNLEKISTLPKSLKNYSWHPDRSVGTLSPSLFIEEPGKTKTVNLKNTAPAITLSHLNPGDPVVFFPKKHSIDIRTLNKDYLGALPDDFAFRLLRFLKAGYQYNAFIKSVSKKGVSVFIREQKRAKRFKYQPTFLTVPLGGQKNKLAEKSVPDLDEEEENEKVHEEEDS